MNLSDPPKKEQNSLGIKIAHWFNASAEGKYAINAAIVFGVFALIGLLIWRLT